ncbi:MAG: excinuclease ABC subunit UvrA [Candidatus Sungbacteria bacterium]|uniref:UvrABC system protein A n=1 Tax=Candidatus Sungiibacteriota bacterium TaxID=2750080 RepID=A0A932QZX7_9BACT|nr:excinuclease ABC subunit UvrA [Candidatus Sungbacteria bacterium]
MAQHIRNKNGEYIRIRGARVHNLKNVDADIPKNKLVVITGLSGSGKSSLAFDTIYAEAERRFVESLSSYARQFLGVKDKPDVESIDGLSPAISIDQKSISRNPRSTVGTITEIYDYLRILFARIGRPHCPQCGKPVGRQSIEKIVDTIAGIRTNAEILILAPLVRDKKGEHKSIVAELRHAGFLRVRFDGALYAMDDALNLAIDKKRKHTLEVVVDRLGASDEIERSRIRDSVETALKIGKGLVIAGESARSDKDTLFSEHFACSDCGINLPDIEPRTFSFNSPYGACQACTGLGATLEVDPELVLPNKRLSIAEGAIRPWAAASHRVGRQSWYWWILDDLASRHGFLLSTPVGQLAMQVIDMILYGEKQGTSAGERGTFEGVIPNLKRRWKETDSDFTRAEIEKYMIITPCSECGGKRISKVALAVRIGEDNIASIAERTVEDALGFFSGLIKSNTLNRGECTVATPLVKEIEKRLLFLRDVGLEYLTLERESTTLSGGEAQRIQLATQIGSRLTGIIYILDEPSIGLHPRDHSRLIATIKDLRDLGNTVILVEHDEDTMRSADWIIDIGPGAGKHGGKIIFSGTPRDIVKARTLTGEYLSGRKRVGVKKGETETRRGKANPTYLTIRGAAEHNLKNIDVTIPLGKFVCVSGVSGSGKSTLVNDIVAKALLARLHGSHMIPGKHKDMRGVEHINKVVVVDQSPIGRTPRSNPATYTGAFGFIRSVFAATPDARVRGYGPGRFSFNVKGGRCEACEGQGVKKIEMYFLPDVYVECEECRGLRYSREALDIEYNGKNIDAVLNMSIEEALAFFNPIPAIKAKFETLVDVGLGYMKVGQSAPTLSGGEAQRVKLATELSRRDTGSTLYILDEPTTGLHFDDIQKLLAVLSALVDKGNTVLVIEHNLDILRNADWIIDLGPDAGDKGGTIVAQGTPAHIAKIPSSHTGQWLKKSLHGV